MLTLASCGTFLFGTYESGTTKATFSGKKVTVVDEVTVLGTVISKTYEAEYKISEDDEGNKTIVFTYADGADKHLVFSGEKTFSQGDEDGVKYIRIGLIKYEKKD
jgi:hypothetical protein